MMDSVDDSIELSGVHQWVVLVAVADLAAARRPLDLQRALTLSIS